MLAMLDICSKEVAEWDLAFNAHISVAFSTGSHYNCPCASLSL